LFGVSRFESAPSNDSPNRTRKMQRFARSLPLPTPLPTLQNSSHHSLCGIHTRRSKEKQKEKADGADRVAVACSRLGSCLWIIVVQSLWCFQSKKSRPCWRRRWWPGQPGEQRWRQEQRRWSRCLQSSPASRRPAPRWSSAWAFQHVQPSSCWRHRPSQYQRHRWRRPLHPSRQHPWSFPGRRSWACYNGVSSSPRCLCRYG